MLLAAPAQAQATSTAMPATQPQQVEVVQTSSGKGFPWGLLGLFGLLGLARRRSAKVVYLPAEPERNTLVTDPADSTQPEGELIEIDEIEEIEMDEALELLGEELGDEEVQTVRIVPGSEYTQFEGDPGPVEEEAPESRFSRGSRRR